MAWSHSTPFRHYIRKFPQGSTTFTQIDLEQQFKCRYVSLSGKTGKPKQIYKENFAEANGVKVWNESPAKMAYDSSKYTLTLRWRSDECDDVITWSDKFTAYIMAQKLEYHDTFKTKKYMQFICEEQPTVKAEKLYGDQQYRYLEYKLTNYGGKGYDTTQIQ